jgi:hypothetical protein
MMHGMGFMLNRRRRYTNSAIPAWMAKRTSDESPRGAWWSWSKLGPLLLEKVLLVGVATLSIFYFQKGMQRSEERLEKARRIGEILIDKPVSIVEELPVHLDAFILYAEHIRSHDLEGISSARLTDLQATIRSDLEGCRAYYSSDPDLKSWANQIKAAINAVRAKALSKNSLGREDLDMLEDARDLAYRFHHRVICLSVRQALEPFDTADEQHCRYPTRRSHD